MSTLMDNRDTNSILFLLTCNLLFISSSISTTDTLLPGKPLRDWEYRVSAGGSFKLGFFSPGASRNRYLGIWCNRAEYRPAAFDSKRVVWVANRENPIPDASGVFAIDEYGTLIITYSGGKSIVLNSIRAAGNVSARLLESGNLIVRELNSNGSVRSNLWQSHDYPTHMLLPGMKLGMNFKTGQTWSLTSWISDEVPAPGSFTFGGDPNGTSQVIISWHGNVYWTSGLWSNDHFEFVPRFSTVDYYNFSYVSDEDKKYLTFSMNKSITVVEGFMMDSTGAIIERGGLAPFGSCSYESVPGCVMLQNSPTCRLLDDWFSGPRRGDIAGDSIKFDQSYNLSILDCKDMCWKNCSCVAYAFINDNKTGCELWSQVTHFAEYDPNGREVHFIHSWEANRSWMLLITVAAGAMILLAFCFVCCMIRRKRRVEVMSTTEEIILLNELKAYTAHATKSGRINKLELDGKNNHGLQFFSFESIVSATNSFATANKLGEGGFGPVYKGELQNGQEIAIKRLSKNSGQGLVEFKNEVVLIAKLQHTNLVRLLGCYIQREEKILIYEFMPNKSLDFFIFGPSKNLLSWKKRLHIIEGIAQGLLYLHKYSRLRIIHRDLKASNILLDGEMNPKISDFGMARIFGRNESEANTKRVVGTYGYMSPEYAMEGIFSIKSDVYSFGVLLLEIVSGRKNTSFYHTEKPLNLIGYAWEFWKDGRGLELADSVLDDSYGVNEVLRCIHIGLLCVQESSVDRPDMSDVIAMISNETPPPTTPKQPAFILSKSSPPNKPENRSFNKLSISEFEGR